MSKKKWTTKKKIRNWALGLTALVGTFGGHGKDFPPIYVNKTETGGGLCAGIYTHIEKDVEFYGPVISLFNHNEGTINGVTGSIVNENSGIINGLEISLISNLERKNFPISEYGTVNGAQLSLFAQNNYTNGIQVGIMPFSKNTNGVQVGAMTVSENGNVLQVAPFCVSDKSRCVQVGVYCLHSDLPDYKNKKQSLLFNYNFR